MDVTDTPTLGPSALLFATQSLQATLIAHNLFPKPTLHQLADSHSPMESKTKSSSEDVDGSFAAKLTPPDIIDTVDYENVYRMDHKRRGRLLILNNRVFLPSTRLPARDGTDEDAAALYRTFTGLGFAVRIVSNKTTTQMMQAVLAAVQEEEKEKSRYPCDSFAMAILSHGDDGLVYGTDGPITIHNLLAPIRYCKALAGKPKLFFIQACRGTDLDAGQDKTDALDEPDGKTSKPQRIPLEADFLYAYSTPPGYFSFRSTKTGSWFIQALCEVFQEHGTQLEIIRLLTRVNRKVAYECESVAKEKSYSQKKQIPSIVSMLTKELYFPPKQL